MAGEGEVIACHTLEDWFENINVAGESNKLIVIHFTASSCPPCHFIADKAKRFTNVVFLEIDVDELHSLAREFDVETMPTFVFLKQGEIVDSVLGASEDQIHQTLIKCGGLESSA